jgi:putative transposase
MFVGRGFSRDKKGPIKGASAPEGADVGRIARRVHQAGAYFITTDTWQKHPLFINTALAKIVVEQIVSCRDRGFYKLHAFVLMPDHLHVLLTPGEATTVEKAMQMIKGGSAHRIGKEQPQNFPIWNSGFHDRWMRDEQEYRSSKRYIEQKPVEAKLAGSAERYEYSSASGKYVLDLCHFDQVRG